MKISAKHSLMALAAFALAAATGCTKEEVYDTEVTREYNLFLDGEPYFNKTEDSHTYGDWNVFIYKPDGKLKGNYKTQYRFALEKGSYKVLAVYSPTVSRLFPEYKDLGDVYIEQDPKAATRFAASDAVNYRAGEPMNVNIVTRTGLLRLRAIDEKADKSYSQLRATITTPITAYHPADSKVKADGEPLELVRQKEVNGGGIGYAEDLLLIGSRDHKVDIRIDYLDAEGNVVNSKPFPEGIQVNPNDTTTVQFYLNNPDERVFVDYTITMGSTRWDNENLYPSVPVVVPDGYTYVEPGASLDAAFNSLLKDDSVDEIKLFLKASGTYSLASATLDGCGKAYSIVGQAPGYGQTQAQLTLSGTAAPVGNLKEIRFENLILKAGARLFNIRNQEFNVGEVAFVNCTIDGWSGVLWNQVTNADNQQMVGTVRLEGCRITNYTAQSTPLFNLPTNRLAPIGNFIFRDNIFHGKTYTTRTVILSKLTKMANGINIVVEGNTFIDTKGTEFTYFDIDGAKAASLNLTVKGNLIAGPKSSGTWFKLGKTTSVEASGNTRTAGYEMKYGVDAPEEVSTTYTELLNKLNL